MDKSFKDQAERIEKQRVKKLEEKRAAQKKAEKKEQQEKLEEKKAKKLQNKEDSEVVITADSIEDLMRKVEDYNYLQMSDSVKTDAEKYIGTVIDFKG